MPAFQHSEESDRTIADLARQGMSASQIGAVLGITRNVVIGRSHRRGIQLNPQRQPAQRKRASARPVVSKTVTLPRVVMPIAKPVVIKPVKPVGEGVTFFDLGPRSCRYPHGERFCGAETSHGSSWCGWHRAIVYRPVVR